MWGGYVATTFNVRVEVRFKARIGVKVRDGIRVGVRIRVRVGVRVQVRVRVPGIQCYLPPVLPASSATCSLPGLTGSASDPHTPELNPIPRIHMEIPYSP